MEHTKGPWDYDIYDDHDAFAFNDGGEDYTARIEWREGIPDQERLANLHLISAAPDLLAALEWIAEHDKEFGDIEDYETQVTRIIEKARTAIAKAKGGSHE